MSSPPPNQSLVRTAAREAVATFFVWLATLSWTVGYSYTHGYGRTAESLTFVLGFPDWIFWGVMLPWVVCFLVSAFFAFVVIKDAPLGGDENGDDEPSTSGSGDA
jgi:hypothetical protein